MACLSLAQAAKIHRWTEPGEFKKRLILSLIFLIKMLCHSGQNKNTTMISPLTCQTWPTPLSLEAHEMEYPLSLYQSSLCDMPHQLTSTHTHQKRILAPFGIRQFEDESTGHFSSGWNTVVEMRDDLLVVPNSSPCVLSKEPELSDQNHQNQQDHQGKKVGEICLDPTCFWHFCPKLWESSLTRVPMHVPLAGLLAGVGWGPYPKDRVFNT